MAKARRQFLLDDVPYSIHRNNQTSGSSSSATQPAIAGNALICEAFAAERLGPERKQGTAELDLRSLAPKDWEKMQAALSKEWNTRLKYDACTIVSGNAAKRVPEEKILTSKVVWTDKGNGSDFQPKARIVGRGFEEEYDEKLRRDSPTVSAQMTLLAVSLISSLNLDMVLCDVTGAFLQGQKIDRELYFRILKNLGKTNIPGVQPGDLLKLKNPSMAPTTQPDNSTW